MKRKLLRVVRFNNEKRSSLVFYSMKGMIMFGVSPSKYRGALLQQLYRIHRVLRNEEETSEYWCDKTFEFKDRLNKRWLC